MAIGVIHIAKAVLKGKLGLITISTGIILSALAIPSSADACSFYNYPLFDGMVTSTISTSGAQAQISNYDPRICWTSSAWSMIANNTNGNELAQIG